MGNSNGGQRWAILRSHMEGIALALATVLFFYVTAPVDGASSEPSSGTAAQTAPTPVVDRMVDEALDAPLESSRGAAARLVEGPRSPWWYALPAGLAVGIGLVIGFRTATLPDGPDLAPEEAPEEQESGADEVRIPGPSIVIPIRSKQKIPLDVSPPPPGVEPPDPEEPPRLDVVIGS